MMKKTPGFLWLIVAAFLMNCLGAATALAWPVPDTGQTTCYDNTAVLAPCPTLGQAFYGQDASYTINPMSYTKLDENGDDLPVEEGAWTMVRDNVTGLIWELKQEKDSTPNYDNPHDADNKYLWYDSNPATNGGNAGTQGDGVTTFDTEQFIAALNDANYGGHDDWRLPTIKELASIVNSSIPYPGPTINTTFFPNTNMFWHWSSTTHSIVTDCAWDVYFDEGNDYSHYKDNGGCVRAVRGGQAGSLDHLVINGDGTVTDTDTGLMWDQDTPDNAMTWESALSTFENSTWAGYTDWRLPTIQELRSLVDYSRFNPVINITYFPDTAASCYWSSTTYANGTDVAWGMYFDYGGDYLNFKDGLYYVRAVRGGQAGSLGNLVISSPKQASEWAIGALMPIRWNTADLGTNVKISLSRQGGKIGTFETIMASTPNDGQHDWTVAGFGSVNCVIKIEQADNAANWATEGLFVIKSPVNPAIYLLLLE
jgi:hypothetical protein